ncbi:hypothetical protein FRC0497_01186 [Corynebacterium diphtheriae]|nr:hypothetical protein FRC0497_01186 [Corynebacterium diphtheriae]
MEKIAKLNISSTENGINLDIDGASEGIHIEYEILPDVLGAIMKCALGRRQEPQSN